MPQTPTEDIITFGGGERNPRESSCRKNSAVIYWCGSRFIKYGNNKYCTRAKNKSAETSNHIKNHPCQYNRLRSTLDLTSHYSYALTLLWQLSLGNSGNWISHFFWLTVEHYRFYSSDACALRITHCTAGIYSMPFPEADALRICFILARNQPFDQGMTEGINRCIKKHTCLHKPASKTSLGMQIAFIIYLPNMISASISVSKVRDKDALITKSAN